MQGSHHLLQPHEQFHQRVFRGVGLDARQEPLLVLERVFVDQERRQRSVQIQAFDIGQRFGNLLQDADGYDQPLRIEMPHLLPVAL